MRNAMGHRSKLLKSRSAVCPRQSSGHLLIGISVLIYIFLIGWRWRFELHDFLPTLANATGRFWRWRPLTEASVKLHLAQVVGCSHLNHGEGACNLKTSAASHLPWLKQDFDEGEREIELSDEPPLKISCGSPSPAPFIGCWQEYVEELLSYPRLRVAPPPPIVLEKAN